MAKGKADNVKPLLYLASPYSKFPGGLDEAARLARANHGLLLSAGLNVFCPIAHAHDTPVNRRDYELWLRVDEALAARSDVLLVLLLEGWDTSHGVTQEIGWFKKWGKPIIHMTPGIVPDNIVRVYA